MCVNKLLKVQDIELVISKNLAEDAPKLQIIIKNHAVNHMVNVITYY